MEFLEVPEYADCIVQRGSYVSKEMYGIDALHIPNEGRTELQDLDPLPQAVAVPGAELFRQYV